MVERGSEHVERAEQVNLDHRTEGVGRQPGRGRKEIACGARDDHVDLAPLLGSCSERTRNGVEVANVGNHADGVGARRLHALSRDSNPLLIAADDRDVGAHLAEAFGDAEVDARGSASDENGLALEGALTKQIHDVSFSA